MKKHSINFSTMEPSKEKSRRPAQGRRPVKQKRMASSDGQDEKAAAPSAAALPKREDLKKFNILIVDDEDGLREALVFEFKRKGFTGFSAENGKKAYEIFQNNKVDLVISDVRMPEWDGITLLEKIRSTADGKSPKLIFITGFSDVAVDDLIAKGAIQVLSKPFDRKELVKCAMTAIGMGN